MQIPLKSLSINSKLIHFERKGKKVYDRVLHSSINPGMALEILRLIIMAAIGDISFKISIAAL
jgi:hypothetical protein